MKGRRKEGEEPRTDLLTEYLLKLTGAIKDKSSPKLGCKLRSWKTQKERIWWQLEFCTNPDFSQNHRTQFQAKAKLKFLEKQKLKEEFLMAKVKISLTNHKHFN